MSPAIHVELVVRPTRVSPESLAGLTATIAVTNAEDDVIDPGIRQSSLIVDGTPSFGWSFAIGNGAGTAREHALPPGERVEVARTLDPGLFDEPGEHVLVAEVAGQRSQPVRITVDSA